jgi:hypothetical protein
MLYILTSYCLWAYSLTYFGDVVTLWEKSPAESRARNVECTFLGMYDSHDVWHFISAAALFSSMMVSGIQKMRFTFLLSPWILIQMHSASETK